MNTEIRSASPWAPLKNRLFLTLWLATLFSTIGTWMNDVGSGWLMAGLSPNPVMIAAIQAMTTLPVFLLALPAGAVADIVDRRKLLLIVNVFMLCVATVLAFLVYSDRITINLLLITTFFLGAGAAFLGPAWQAIVPGIIERSQLKSGIALNSLGINISRAIGPAIAGLLIAQVGLFMPFIINALSFVGIILAVWWWKGEKREDNTLPAESVIGAMIGGLRYARHSPALMSTLIRAFCFFIFASAYWAMLPLIAKNSLNGDASLYGILTASIGLGAVVGAMILPTLRARCSATALVALGSVSTALVLVVFAMSTHKGLAIVGSVLAGMSWIMTLSSLMISAQTVLPDWVRARGLALYLTVFSGAMALGSLLWGQVAFYSTISMSLLIASAGMILLLLLTHRIPLYQDGSDLEPVMHWAMPPVIEDAEAKKGPVMVHIRYQVNPGQLTAFLDLMHQLKKRRLRDGSYSWNLFSDPEQPETYIETFMLSSWTAHLRQHQRVTKADKALQEKIRQLTVSSVVSHYLPADNGKHK